MSFGFKGIRIKIRRIGDWGEARALLSRRGRERFKKTLILAVRKEAEYARGLLVTGIRKQAPGGKKFKELSPQTLARRRMGGFRGRKALIVRGDLRNAIHTKHFPKASFVGVLRTAKSKTGKSLVNIMAIQEYGSKPIVIPITKKMLRFFAIMNRKVGTRSSMRTGGGGGGVFGVGGFIIVKIPARPVFAPVFKMHFGKAAAQSRMLNRISLLLKGKYGFVSAK